MNKKFTICNLEELSTVSNFLDPLLSKTPLILLKGDLGTGKTALVKDIVQKRLGVNADSPSFALINEYRNKEDVIYHFDLYRLKSVEEIEEIGFWDYVQSGIPCFIEWPEKIAELLPPGECVTVDIALNLDRCREFSISYPSS
ncbi:MAG: tRNA (adenosine(37)-N6)-threonylcarbamoyltransferase complex ATPase subunit type 1 TsaE [Bacteroidia bacterium]